jgi:hypothetical protein
MGFSTIAAVGLGAAGLVSASKQSSAQKKAAEAQAQASAADMAEARRQDALSRADLEPFRQSGLAAQRAFDVSMGFQPVQQQTMPQQVFGFGGNAFNPTGAPTYDFALNPRGQSQPGFIDSISSEGGDFGPVVNAFLAQQATQQAQSQTPTNPLDPFRASAMYALPRDPRILNDVNAMYSAKGMGLDGSAIKAAQDRIANDDYGRLMDYMNLAGGQSAQGLGVQNNLNALGQNLTAQNSAARQNAANAQASSYIGQANAFNSGLSGVAGAVGWLGNQKGWF